MEWEAQHSSAPSTPNSFSSQGTGISYPPRTDKIPTLKQLSPSPSVTALSKLSDDDLRRKGKEELLVMLRRVESDYKAMLGEHGNVVKDVNRRYQIFILESRNLKEVNQKLQDDNQELRDLCCFLDDDRQRGRKLAREWQRFGRYTASVMRSEVAVYQEKLQELEKSQSELVTENMELKELCLFLDQERTRITGDRDEGDGSSNGTTTGLEDGIISSEANGTALSTNSVPSIGSSHYLRELEQKVQKLEEEKRILAQRVNRNTAGGLDGSHSWSNDTTLVQENGTSSGMGDEPLHGSGLEWSSKGKLVDSTKPDAVVHAMKVLQVHEELEKTPTEDDNWDDSEKAILREMCNVVWRKLGDVGDIGSFNESSDSILDPPMSGGGSHPSLVPGMHGKTQSFNLPQPQPQMASTPLASITKGPSSPNTQHVNPRPTEPSRMSPTKSFQTSSQNQPLYQTQAKKTWLPQTDQRVDMYSGGGLKDQATADVRPVSPLKRPDPDQIGQGDYERRIKPNQPPPMSAYPHQQSQPYDYPPHSQASPTTKQFQYAEDEKIPPHFLPHRRQQPMQQYTGSQQQQQQPIPYSGSHHHQPPQSLPSYTAPQYRPPHNSSNNKQPSSQHAQPQYPPHSNTNTIMQGKPIVSPSSEQPPRGVQMPSRSASSSSSTAPPPNVSSHHNSSTIHSYPNHQQQLSSSQQYPQHHPVRLLEAPGGIHQPNPKHDQRAAAAMSREDNKYVMPQQQQPLPPKDNPRLPPQQMMFQRRDEIKSEPNVSQSGIGGNMHNRGLENQTKGGREPTGYPPRQDNSNYPGHHSSRFASDSSQSQQVLSSRPNHSQSQYHHNHQDSLPPSANANILLPTSVGGGGFSAYPPQPSGSVSSRMQHPLTRAPPQPIQKTPVMPRAHAQAPLARQQQQQGQSHGGKVLPPPQQQQRNTIISRSHYDDYDSDSL